MNLSRQAQTHTEIGKNENAHIAFHYVFSEPAAWLAEPILWEMVEVLNLHNLQANRLHVTFRCTSDVCAKQSLCKIGVGWTCSF